MTDKFLYSGIEKSRYNDKLDVYEERIGKWYTSTIWYTSENEILLHFNEHECNIGNILGHILTGCKKLHVSNIFFDSTTWELQVLLKE